MELESAIANDVNMTTAINNDPINLDSAIANDVVLLGVLTKRVDFKTELVLEEFTV